MADFTIKAHDRLPSIQAALTTTDGAVNLTGATVTFILSPSVGGTPKVNAAATVADVAGGIVRYDWLAIDTATPGEFLAEWQVTWGDGKRQTFPTGSYHQVAIVADLDAA